MSEQIYIFNPEHDLCIANWDENFVPQRSAVVIIWQENCTYIWQTTILADEEENDAFH